VLALAGSFFMLLVISKYFKFLNSINAINRPSYGSITYPVAIYLCFIVFKSSGQVLYYYVPLIIFIISDPLAALVGIQTKWRPYTIYNERKTVGGSLAFLTSAFLLTYGIVYYNIEAEWYEVVFYSLTIACVSTVAEAISYKGLDNLLVPVACIITLYLLNF